MKRLMDIVVSGLLLLFTWVLLLVLALLVKVDSKGPVLFRQRRIGKNKQPFEILKFRTMIDRPADSIDQLAERPVYQTADSRITRLGKFLRASSLDELPQLINVLRGDMSLVGPRPIIPEQLKVVPHWYQARFEVQPGITGLAQVMGRRGLSWEEQLQYDAEYARSYGVARDVKIMLQTISSVYLQKGVYSSAGRNWRMYMDEWSDKQDPPK